MKSSEYGRITDELLSAYIDNAVTEQERTLVEAAVATDSEVAWRLDTLEQTVQMLHSLPELALPRSFTLQESHLLDAGPSVAIAAAGTPESSRLNGMVGGWRGFWRSGSAVYRNLAAASLVLLLVLVGGNRLMDTSAGGLGSITAPAAELASGEVPAAAESVAEAAAAEAAPAQDSASTDASVGDTVVEEPILEGAPQEKPAAEEAAAEESVDETAPGESAEEQSAVESPPNQTLRPQDGGARSAAEPQAAAAALYDAPESQQAAEAITGEGAALGELAIAAAPLAAEPPVAETLNAEALDTEAPAVESFAAQLATPEVPAGAAEALGAAAARAGAAPEPNQLQRAQPEQAQALPAQLERTQLDEAGNAEFAATAAEPPPVAVTDGVDIPPAAAEEDLAVSAASGSGAAEPVAATESLSETESVAALDTDAAALETFAEETVSAEMLEETQQANGESTTDQVTASDQAEDGEELTDAVAALPSAQQSVPAAVQQGQPDPSFTAGVPAVSQLVTLALLAATLLFGGLWWRSRRA